MSINKRALLLPLAAITSLALNILLLPANCRQNEQGTLQTIANRHKDDRAQPATPKRSGETNRPTCSDDEDCPGEEICEDSKCITLDDYEDQHIDAGEETPNEVPTTEGPRTCANTEDCGCGYECKYDECRKLESSCNVDGDCNTGDFCNKEHNQLCGTCAKSECKTDNDCGDGCNDHCYKNRCVQYGCCSNSDCEMDYFCYTFNGSEGVCRQIECYVDSDCGCGFICDQTSKSCLDRSTDRPIRCCGGYVYYEQYGSCIPQYLIEDGNCLDSSHCKRGEVCNTDVDTCYPATCKENMDCGFESVCRKGHCEHGCDDNTGCNDEYPVCDRGECINPDENEE